ncbi:MAG: hypothetical protein IKJ13_01770 [Clostridia bacterium]|nr:hypothetical protein [Clostridia bacterium]
MGKNYDDIIDLPCPTSDSHPRMARADRAAQFAPFSALTGYDLAIFEAARLTEREVMLSEDIKERLDRWHKLLLDIRDAMPLLKITYYLPDKRKTGGSYKTAVGHLTSYDEHNKTVTIDRREIISLIDVKEIDSELFREMFDESYT